MLITQWDYSYRHRQSGSTMVGEEGGGGDQRIAAIQLVIAVPENYYRTKRSEVDYRYNYTQRYFK